MTTPSLTPPADAEAPEEWQPDRNARSPQKLAATVLGLVVTALVVLLVGPGLLILGLIGVGFVVATFWRPEIATIAFFFVIWANLLAVAAQFHGAPAVLAGCFVLILCIPLLHRVIVRREPIVVTSALPFLLGYLASMLVAAAASAAVGPAVRPIGDFLIEGLLLYLLVSNSVRTPGTLRRAIWAIILASALLGSLSLVQEATHAYQNNFGGLAQVTTQGFKVDEEQGTAVLRPRLSGSIGEQNRYAQVLLMAAPLAFFRAKYERERRLRILATGCGIAIFAGVLLTFSRGAMVAAGVLFVMLIMRGYVRFRYAIIGIGVVGLALIMVEPDYITRLSSLTEIGPGQSDSGTQKADGAVVGRATSNLAAWNTFVAHPLTGVGPGRYFVDYSQKAGNELNLRYFDKNRRAHNMYLEVAADLGVFGIAMLLGAVGVTAYQLANLQRYWRTRDPQLAALASSLLFALAAYMVTAVFLHLSYQRYFWTILSLANSTIWVLAGERRRASSPPSQLSTVP